MSSSHGTPRQGPEEGRLTVGSSHGTPRQGPLLSSHGTPRQGPHGGGRGSMSISSETMGMAEGGDARGSRGSSAGGGGYGGGGGSRSSRARSISKGSERGYARGDYQIGGAGGAGGGAGGERAAVDRAVYIRQPVRTQPWKQLSLAPPTSWERTAPGAPPPKLSGATMRARGGGGGDGWGNIMRTGSSGMSKLKAVTKMIGIQRKFSGSATERIDRSEQDSQRASNRAMAIGGSSKKLLMSGGVSPRNRSTVALGASLEQSPIRGVGTSNNINNNSVSSSDSPRAARKTKRVKQHEDMDYHDYHEPPPVDPLIERLCRPREVPHYITPEYMSKHYDPKKREATLEYHEFLPLVPGAGNSSRALQKDTTDALIVLSTNGDENKESFGRAGAVVELLDFTESTDARVRCNAVTSLSNLLTHESNRETFFATPRAVQRLVALTNAKVQAGTMVQPSNVKAMRAATAAISQLARTDSPVHKQLFMGSGLIKPLVRLTASTDKRTRMAAVRGVQWLCLPPGKGSVDMWDRKAATGSAAESPVEWSSEQILDVVSAADSEDPDVTKIALLGIRWLCTPGYVAVMLSRSNILHILRNSLRGELFREHFSLLVAANSLVCALADTVWPSGVFENEQHMPMLGTLLSLLPSTETEVKAMQSARGAMSTWGHDELMSKAVYMAAHPECGPAEVGEIFPESFRQLQCFVLVEDVLDVIEKLMLKMLVFRESLFHLGAAKSFVTLHLYTQYKSSHLKCLRALCLMAGSEKLAAHVGNDHKYLDIIDFALGYTLNPILPKTCVISIKELSKDVNSIKPLIQRGLVQSLGRLTDTNDPTVQINLIIAFTNLARKRVAKDQIAALPQWPNIVHYADSFDPGVRREVSNLFVTMCSGEDSHVCREALLLLYAELKHLTRSSRIAPEVARKISNYVNQSDKIILAQAVIRGFLGRRYVKRLHAHEAAKPESERNKLSTSAVMKALTIFTNETSRCSVTAGKSTQSGAMPIPKTEANAASTPKTERDAASPSKGGGGAASPSKGSSSAEEEKGEMGGNGGEEDRGGEEGASNSGSGLGESDKGEKEEDGAEEDEGGEGIEGEEKGGEKDGAEEDEGGEDTGSGDRVVEEGGGNALIHETEVKEGVEMFNTPFSRGPSPTGGE